jgi:predicted O-methyltransferase YrrM
MKKSESRHKQKFLRIFENEFQRFKKPTILEFGVSSKALSTTIFLNYCKKNKGMLYSVDVKDYGYHFKSKNWKFIISRDDNFDYIKKRIPRKFDIIYLDTIHKADHVKKMIYYYFDKLKKGGLFVIDDTSMLPYLKKREKNNFSLEINNQGTFEVLLKILNTNHKELYFESSFIGTGVVKLTKLTNKKLKLIKSLNNRKFSISNFLRKIYLSFKAN